jgi:hypothetical protein
LLGRQRYTTSGGKNMSTPEEMGNLVELGKQYLRLVKVLKDLQEHERVVKMAIQKVKSQIAKLDDE